MLVVSYTYVITHVLIKLYNVEKNTSNHIPSPRMFNLTPISIIVAWFTSTETSLSLASHHSVLASHFFSCVDFFSLPPKIYVLADSLGRLVKNQIEKTESSNPNHCMIEPVRWFIDVSWYVHVYVYKILYCCWILASSNYFWITNIGW